jgi:Acetyltransferase (GNAT) domain
MIVVKTPRGPLEQIDAYYARQDEANDLIANLASHQVLCLRMTPWQLDLPLVLFASACTSFVVDLTVNAGQLLGNMSRSTRYEIHKIQRDQEIARITVRRNTSAVYDDFLKLYNDFSSLNGGTPKLSAARLSRFLPYGEAFVVYADGQPVCGHFDLRDPALNLVIGLWSASTRLDSANPNWVASVNRWLHWRQMNVYKAEGFNTYDLSGPPSDAPGIGKFKRALGANQIPCYDYVVARGIVRIAASLFRRSRSSLHSSPYGSWQRTKGVSGVNGLANAMKYSKSLAHNERILVGGSAQRGSVMETLTDRLRRVLVINES